MILFTNFRSDNTGLGIITGAETDTPQVQGQFPLEFKDAKLDNPFGVHNAEDVVITPDGLYAFVAGFNTPDSDVPSKDHFEPPDNPAGSNIGIFKFQSPYQSPQLVAATRSIPEGFTMGLSVTADGQYLYAVYPETPTDTGAAAVFVYNMPAIEAAINNPAVVPLLGKFGIDDIAPDSGLHVDGDGIVQHNLAIDAEAAFGQINTSGKTVIFGVYNDQHRPLSIGGLPRGLASTAFPLSVTDASGDDTPQTVFQQGAVRVSYDFASVTGSLTLVQIAVFQNGTFITILETSLMHP